MKKPRDSTAYDSGTDSGSPRAITKILLPSKRNGLLSRPRLINFLLEHIDRKLQLVSASAGYGKTSLLVDLAHETTVPVCWYSLDASDGDPKVFVEYLIASLRRKFPNFGSRTLGLLSDPVVLRDVQLIVGTLVTEIHDSIQDYFVIVLDDYQTVEESDTINYLMDTLLRLLPENAHIILASRTLPSRLTLTRLTARQEIAGLGVDDLRFTAPEIQSLVRQTYQVDLSDDQATELARQSEGWITAILLTTHSLWQGLIKELVRVQAPHGQVFSYLASEVFVQQPPELQEFLLGSSIQDQLSPALCDQILDIHNSDEMLQTIERKNLFVTRLEEDEPWYRYHHLFQEFLQSRLKESDPELWVALHRRAAGIYARRGAFDQVIAHYLKAGALDDAARAIERIAKETFDGGRWVTLAKWIDAVPAEVLSGHPDLLVWRAMIYSNTGDLTRAAGLYARALTIYDGLRDSQGIAKTLIENATALRFQGDYPQAVDHCQRALALLNANSESEIAKAHRTIGIACGLMGDWERCIAELEIALQFYQSSGDDSYTALVHQDLGVAYRTAGRRDAASHFQRALDYWRRANNPLGLANTLNSIGVGYHRQGNYAQAQTTLEEACAQARRSGQLRIEAFALASLGDVHRDMGAYGPAQESYQAAFAIAERISEGFVITYILTALAETFHLVGDLATAEDLLRQALEQATNHHSQYELGLTKTGMGIVFAKRGDAKSAEENLVQALELLEQGGAKHDSARAHLHLANVYFRQRKYRLVNAHLQAAADIGASLQQDQFVVAQGPALVALLKYAVSKKIGNGYFVQALERVNNLPTAQTAEPLASADAKEAQVQVRALGSATVLLNGRLVTKTNWDSAASKELFFFLLAHPQGLRKEQILATLWADTPPAKANGIFHSTAWRMRRALDPECLVYENGLYRINRAMGLAYDVAQFEQLIREAESESAEELKAEYLQQAIALYQGDYLEDVYGDWCAPPRAELLRQYLAALLTLVRLYAERAEIGKATALCRKILDKDSFREDVYRELMRLQVKSGNPTAALRTYQRCVEVLEEAHLAPSADTRALAEQIMSGETA